MTVAVAVVSLPRVEPPAAAARMARRCLGSGATGTTVLDEGGVVCFFGEITAERASTFVSAPMRKGAAIVLSSVGGDVAPALDMADFIRAHAASVIVTGVCASSCANYLFVSGAAKVVLPGGLVGFHGGPPTIIASMPDHTRIFLKTILERQHELYRHTGANERVMYEGPLHAPLDPMTLHHVFWEYGPTTLRERFGIAGIEYFATPSDLPWFRHVQCEAAGADAWICMN